MLHRVEHAHRDVFYPVLVAGHHAAPDLAVKGILPAIVGFAGMGVELFDKGLRDRAFLAQPDRCAEDHDVRLEHVWRECGPVIPVPSVIRHVGIYAGRELILGEAMPLHADILRGENLCHDVQQRVGMRWFAGMFQRCVEQHRFQVGKVRIAALANRFLCVAQRHKYPFRCSTCICIRGVHANCYDWRPATGCERTPA